MKTLLRRAALAAAIGLSFTGAASAQSIWTGGSGNWSSAVAPGWTKGGVPNAVGATATIDTITANTVITQDVGAGVTVGTLSFAPTVASDFSETITLTNALTLNQDGAGAGFATISNSNASTNTANALILSAGTLTLADNLLVSNTGASTNTTGAIQIISTIGGAGNITLANNSTALTQAGSIRLQTGVNTFTGSVLVQKGTTTFNNAATFGNAANVITLGQAGQGSAALLQTAQVNVVNQITVTPGSGGTLTLGSLSTANGIAYSGAIALNAPLTLFGSATIGSNSNQISGVITGSSNLTITGAGSTALTAANPAYSGTTNIISGELMIQLANSAGTGQINLGDSTGTASAALRLGPTATTTYANNIVVVSGSSGTKTINNRTAFATTLSGTITMNNPLTIASNLASAVITTSGTITNNGNTLTLTNNNTASINISGNVTGTGGVTINGSSTGNVVFQTTQKVYSGNTTINSATPVVIPSISSVGPANAPTSGPFGTGTFVIGSAGASMRSTTGSSQTIGNPVTLGGNLTGVTAASEKSLTFSGNATLTASRTINSAIGSTVAGQTLSFTGVIDDGGSGFGITKTGNGALTLGGANTYSGATTISAGTVLMTNALALQNSAYNTTGSTGAIGLNVTGGLSAGTLRLGGLAGAVDIGTAATGYAGVTNLSLTPLTGASNSYTGIIADGSVGMTLSKSGAGTQALGGTNTYTGATTVSDGTLSLTGTGSINTSSGITVSGSGAKFLHSGTVASTPVITLTQGTLTGSGTVGDVNVGAATGGIISNNNGVAGAALTTGNVTFAGAATINTFSSTTATTIAAGTLNTNVAGTVTINPSATTWANATTYDLVTYTGGSIGGAGFGQFALGTVTGTTARQSVVLGDTGSAITLAITGDSPKWTGGDNGNWQLGTTGANENWKLVTAGTPTTFIATDNVLFDDTVGTGATTIDINAANVAPTSTVFNNTTAVPYTVGSSSGFGISSGFLTKSNTGTVTLSSPNTYTGATLIQGGVLRLSGAGTPGLTGNTGSIITIDTGAVLDLNGTNQSLRFAAGTGGTGATAGVVANNSGSGVSTLTFAGTAPLTGNTVVIQDFTTTPGGKVAVVIQANLQPLNNANTYSGGTTVNGGAFLYLNSANPNGAGTGPINLTAPGSGLPNNTGSGLVLDGVTYTNDINGAGYVHQNSNAGATVVTTTLTGNINTSGAFIFRAGTGIVYDFAGNGTNSTLSGVIGSTTSQINGAVATGSVVKSGTGILTLSGANAFTGTLTVKDGTLSIPTINNVSVVGPLGNSANAVTLGDTGTTGTLQYTGATATSTKPFAIATGGSGTFEVTTGATNLTLSGVHTGSGAIQKIGAGTLTFSGANTGLTGGVAIKNGTLSTTVATGLGATTNAVTLGDTTGSNNATLNIGGNITVAQPITVATGSSGTKFLTKTSTGTAGISGGITLNDNLTVNITAAGNINVSATAITGTGNLTIQSAGTGIWVPQFANTYSGTTRLVSGLAVANVDSTGSATTADLTSGPYGTGTLSFEGGSTRPTTSGTGNIIGNAVSIAADITFTPSNNNTLTFNGPVTLTGTGVTRTLTYAQAGGTIVFSGNIGDGGGVNNLVIGTGSTGTFNLSGANTYTGTTTVNTGRLLINGNSSAAMGAVSVGALATLGGGGTVGGSTTVASTGIVAPGNSAGNLTFAAGADLSAGGVYNWELGALSIANPGTDYDTITVSGGNLALAGTSALTLNFGLIPATGPNSADAFWTTSQTWKIIDISGTGTNTGSTNLSTITNATYTSGSFATTVGTGADAGDIFLVFTPVVGGPSIWQGANNDPWTAASSWTGSVPNSASAEARFESTGGITANLDMNQTVNKLTFDSTNPHTISGSNTLTLAGTTPTISTAMTNNSTQTVAVNLDLAAGTAISVQGGTLELNSPANAVLGAGVTATVASGATLSLGGAGNALSNGTSTHVNVSNSGTLLATSAGKRVGDIDGTTGTTTVTAAGATLTANHIRQSTLNIGAGNTVTVATNGGDSGTSTLTNLSIDATGKLDLTNNDLIVDNGNLTTLTAKLASGLDITGSYGSGPGINGITSSTFANDPNFNTVLGIASNADLGYATFSGQTIDSNDVLIKYTYFGDADLNGVVDGATDFDLYITGLTSGGSLGGWLFGDFDYNGTVDSATDFDLYITGLSSQGGPLLTGGGSNLVQAVPEPSTLVFGALGGIGLAALGLRRRRSAQQGSQATA